MRQKRSGHWSPRPGRCRLPAVASLVLVVAAACSSPRGSLPPSRETLIRSGPASQTPDAGLHSATRLPKIGGLRLAIGAGAVWVASDTLLRVDAATGHLDSSIPAGGFVTTVAANGKDVWATVVDDKKTGAATLVRIDPDANRVAARIPLPEAVQDLAVSDGTVWLLTGGQPDRKTVTLSRIDPVSNEVLATVPIREQGGFITRLLAGPDGAWVLSVGSPSVLSHISAVTNRVVAAIPLPEPANGGIAYGSGGVWIVNRDARSLTKVDARSNRVVGTVGLPGIPKRVTTAPGRAWVLLEPSSLIAIDAATIRPLGPSLLVFPEELLGPKDSSPVRDIGADQMTIWVLTSQGMWRVKAA